MGRGARGIFVAAWPVIVLSLLLVAIVVAAGSGDWVCAPSLSQPPSANAETNRGATNHRRRTDTASTELVLSVASGAASGQSPAPAHAPREETPANTL